MLRTAHTKRHHVRRSERTVATGMGVKERDRNARVAAYCLALSNPVRVRILKFLSAEECIFGDLAKKIPLAQSTISQHLNVLKAVGLIEGQTNGQSTCYCVNRNEIKRMKRMIGEL